MRLHDTSISQGLLAGGAVAHPFKPLAQNLGQLIASASLAPNVQLTQEVWIRDRLQTHPNRFRRAFEADAVLFALICIE